MKIVEELEFVPFFEQLFYLNSFSFFFIDTINENIAESLIAEAWIFVYRETCSSLTKV